MTTKESILAHLQHLNALFGEYSHNAQFVAGYMQAKSTALLALATLEVKQKEN